MSLIKVFENLLRCHSLLSDCLLAIKSLFLNKIKHSCSPVSRIRHVSVFEALENREVFASSPFLLFEIDTITLWKRPVEHGSHQEVSLSKTNQRMGSVEVRLSVFETTVAFMPHTPTLLKNSLSGNKPKFDASGLVGEGESAPFHLNTQPSFSSSNRSQSTIQRLDSGQFDSTANNLQLSTELPIRIEPSTTGTKPGFAVGQPRSPWYDAMLPNDQNRTSVVDTKQSLPDSNRQEILIDTSITDSHFSMPIKTRAGVSPPLHPSTVIESKEAAILNLDTVLAGSLDFFERDMNSKLLKRTSSPNEPTRFMRQISSSNDVEKPIGTGIALCAPDHDRRELPDGMVYLELETKLSANSKSGKADDLDEPFQNAELGLLQWFSTYDDHKALEVDWELSPEIAFVEEVAAPVSGSNSDLMFVLLISGLLGSSRGFLIAKKQQFSESAGLSISRQPMGIRRR